MTATLDRLPNTTPAAPARPVASSDQLVWNHRFASLGSAFYTALPGTPLREPYWVSRNQALADELGLSAAWLQSQETLQALTGNQNLPGAHSLASVYSGHQFGQWAGQLGDGRAILLGELQTPVGGRELQLKGAGRTPYSRMGDGRAVLRSSIREYLCSEAMHGLGLPTTRALCITGSDDRVLREEIETASVVARVAPSFIRFGHFEHFSYQGRSQSDAGEYAALRQLADYVITHFYPECQAAPQPYAAFLQAVSERTASLMAGWQSVGFCHGVMNTDNMSVLGLTIDYGPFQFLDGFNPGHICNHSDSQGRYAFNKQPNIAYWNLFCLGQALLPLIDDQEQALSALESYKMVFPAQLEARMRAKLGLTDDAQPQDKALIEDLYALMAEGQVDYTIFWRRLCEFASETGRQAVRDLFLDRPDFDAWAERYAQRVSGLDAVGSRALMRRSNPKYVLRNHLGEEAIQTAKLKDFSKVDQLLAVLQAPFDEHPEHEAWAGFPPDWAAGIEISCSS